MQHLSGSHASSVKRGITINCPISATFLKKLDLDKVGKGYRF